MLFRLLSPARLCFALCLPIVLLFLGGCTYSPYVDGYFFLPRPVVANLPATQPSQPPPVGATASVIGVRWQDRRASLPESIEVRLRIDNNGPWTVTFDPRYLQLSTGDLVQFPQPITEPGAPVTLGPGESTMTTAYFPFPGDRSYAEFDLRTLQLRWFVYLGQQRVQQVADFHQSYRSYYSDDGPYYGAYGGPYFYPGPVFVGGVVIRRH
jgi:hypothetical protein